MILDTNALSAFAAADLPLLRRLRGVPELALPVIVLGEFRFGICNSRHRRDYEDWLERDLHLFHVLEIVDETTLHYAAIRVQLKRRGTLIPANDAWIAALARQHRMEIVSRDTHFDAVGDVRRLGW